MSIKISYLVSYDYDMLLTSVKQVYKYVDKIIIAIDKNRKTWNGILFVIPQSFFDEVKEFDVDNKIELYFDNFYLPELTPVQNETRERNMVLAKLGKGWKIQLDVDEYIYDFKSVASFLNKYSFLTLFPKLTPICFKGKLITLFRSLPEGFLYIENNEQFVFITNQSFNTDLRNNFKIRNFYTNIAVIHQSWARSEDEIFFKINNWGHRDDFNTLEYFNFWKNVTSENYSLFKDFHPISPKIWNKLLFMDSLTIDEFILKYATLNKQSLITPPIKIFITKLLNKIHPKR